MTVNEKILEEYIKNLKRLRDEGIVPVDAGLALRLGSALEETLERFNQGGGSEWGQCPCGRKYGHPGECWE